MTKQSGEEQEARTMVCTFAYPARSQGCPHEVQVACRAGEPLGLRAMAPIPQHCGEIMQRALREPTNSLANEGAARHPSEGTLIGWLKEFDAEQ